LQKLKRGPLFIVGLTIVFSAFILGYYFGRHYRQDSFYITLQKAPSPNEHIMTTESPVPAAEKININTATVAELCELTGVGPVIAERIIEYREETGGFSHTFEIMNVKGIGKAVYESNKDNMTVR
jgi:comEA protein